jgi:hypothetical protein
LHYTGERGGVTRSGARYLADSPSRLTTAHLAALICADLTACAEWSILNFWFWFWLWRVSAPTAVGRGWGRRSAPTAVGGRRRWRCSTVGCVGPSSAVGWHITRTIVSVPAAICT